MEEEQRIKYLFVSMTLSRYKMWQTIFVCAWLLGAIPAYIFLRNHDFWFLKNLWWICIIIGICEIGETFYAIKKKRSKKQEQ